MRALSINTVAVVASGLLASAAHAGCGDRPGTPTDVKATALSPSSVKFSWRDTTRPGEIPLGPFYDIEVTDGKGNQVGRSSTGEGYLFGGKVYNGLPFNSTFCFKVRARTESGTKGCVSQLWSARVCATTPYPPLGGGKPEAKPLPYGPDTCKQGYVWREARGSDRVCVTPSSRSLVADENRQAASRRQPGGGAYGPNTCKQGYVWREAFTGDAVCVTPDRRSAVKQENARGPSRRVRG